ncbi:MULTISPECIES: hypothetical protein [Streptomyces]|uniref:hypothetical protein n=1 Tax=Streptomyces TaxID=1883 RepID=UPI0004C52F9C|nr:MULTISPECIES: hypothetical protein [unclassified Streptomyces]KPC79781.1 hypothetical protein ADK82_24055 [Streptomyces sp. NRRL S-4]
MPLEAVVVLIVVTVALVSLIAVLSAVAAVLLARRSGASAPSALVQGGVAFGAALTLLALLASTVAGLLP